MKFLNFFQRKPKEIESDTLADFLLHTPEHRKEEIFREVAIEANREQRELFEQARLKAKAL